MVRNTYIFPPDPSMKIIGDIFEYTTQVSWMLTIHVQCSLFVHKYYRCIDINITGVLT